MCGQTCHRSPVIATQVIAHRHQGCVATPSCGIPFAASQARMAFCVFVPITPSVPCVSYPAAVSPAGSPAVGQRQPLRIGRECAAHRSARRAAVRQVATPMP